MVDLIKKKNQYGRLCLLISCGKSCVSFLFLFIKLWNLISAFKFVSFNYPFKLYLLYFILLLINKFIMSNLTKFEITILDIPVYGST